MNRRQFLVTLTAGAATIAGAGYIGLRGGGSAAADAPARPAVVPVTRGDVLQTVTAPGQTVGTREATLAAPAGGRIARLLVRPGDAVAAGQPLLAIAAPDEAELRAPFDGVVLDLLARAEESVSTGQPLVVVGDPAALEVRGTVIEEDLPLVAAGQAADLFFDALPAARTAGRVERIVPYRVSGDRPLYPVYITLAALPAGLVAGMTADAAIVIDQRAAVLRLPRAVVRPRADGTALVGVWTGAGVEERSVRVGLRGNLYTEILDGLSEGEEVVAE